MLGRVRLRENCPGWTARPGPRAGLIVRYIRDVTTKQIKNSHMVNQALLGPQLTTRKLCVQSKDVVYVKAIAQASDGLCCVFSDGGGHLVLASAEDRAADLQQLVRDLEVELCVHGV